MKKKKKRNDASVKKNQRVKTLETYSLVAHFFQVHIDYLLTPYSRPQHVSQ